MRILHFQPTGIRVFRYEIADIHVDRGTREAMEKQSNAERLRRAEVRERVQLQPSSLLHHRPRRDMMPSALFATALCWAPSDFLHPLPRCSRVTGGTTAPSPGSTPLPCHAARGLVCHRP